MRLVGQKYDHQPGGDKESATRVHGRGGLEVGKHGDDGGHDAKNSVRRGAEGVPGPAIFRWEDLGGVGVKDGVHDVAAKVEGAVPTEQGVGSGGGRAAVQEHARRDRGEGQGASTSEPADLDHDPSQERTRDAQHRDDDLVAVGDVGRTVAELGPLDGLQVRQKRIVQRVTQPDEAPDGHDHAGRESKLLGREQRPHVGQVELFEVTLDGRGGRGLLSLPVPQDLARLEVVDGQGGGFAVASGDFVHDAYSFFVVAFAHVVFLG